MNKVLQSIDGLKKILNLDKECVCGSGKKVSTCCVSLVKDSIKILKKNPSAYFEKIRQNEVSYMVNHVKKNWTEFIELSKKEMLVGPYDPNNSNNVQVQYVHLKSIPYSDQFFGESISKSVLTFAFVKSNLYPDSLFMIYTDDPDGVYQKFCLSNGKKYFINEYTPVIYGPKIKSNKFMECDLIDISIEYVYVDWKTGAPIDYDQIEQNALNQIEKKKQEKARELLERSKDGPLDETINNELNAKIDEAINEVFKDLSYEAVANNAVSNNAALNEVGSKAESNEVGSEAESNEVGSEATLNEVGSKAESNDATLNE
jgi:hypothetical protein